jgi:hypothetical protein
MSQQIVQINYRISVPAADWEQAMLPAAPVLADTPGLHWKVWLMAAARSEGGGIYLFEDEDAAQAFINGPAVSGLKTTLGVTDVSVKQFGISEAHTRITRGPVGEGVRV